jgi:hypothetical protein
MQGTGMTIRQNLGVCSVMRTAVLVMVAFPSVACAQIGWSLGQVQSQFGTAQRVYFDADHPAEAVYKIDGKGVAPTRTYLLRNGRVAGLTLEWSEGFSQADVLTQIRQVSGLPEIPLPTTANKAAKPDKKPVKQTKPVVSGKWYGDGQQSRALPPLLAWQNMPIVKPVAKVPIGANFVWQEYYDQWGNYLGKSPTRIDPVFQTIENFLGTVRLEVVKRVMPLVREDAAAYAWVEYSNHTNGRGFATDRIEVMEPELYWRMRFAQIRAEEKRLQAPPAAGVRRQNFNDLRPYHLEVSDDYERALIDHLAVEEVQGLLGTWQTNAVAGMIDNERVSWSVVDEFSSKCDPQNLAAELLRGMKLTKPEVGIRRAEVLDQLGVLRWVTELSPKLKEKQNVSVLLPAMQRMALRHAKTQAEIDSLGEDPVKWNQWYNRMK